MEELSHFVDGAHTPGASGRFADVFNPATGEVQPTYSRSPISWAVTGRASASVGC